MHKLAASITLALLVSLMACGGSSSGNSNSGDGSPSITVGPTSASIHVKEKTQLTANVQNMGNTYVSWAVQESNGGTIVPTSSGAIYTAPGNVGDYHVVVTSVADPTKSATATVNVYGEFLSLQKLVGGTNLPWSVRPFSTTFASDGTWSTSGFVDPQTCGLDPASCKPLDTNAYDIYLSTDGKKAVASIPVEGTYQGETRYFFDIVIADTTPLTINQLTHNETNTSVLIRDYSPQLSPDGTLITFEHVAPDPNSNGDSRSMIATMNVDGSNLQTLLPYDPMDETTWKNAWFPTFSPDGTKLAAEVWWNEEDGNFVDGIATMNVDGSGFKQLTESYNSTSDWCYDTMPAYASDGQKIAFTHECSLQSGGYNDMLFIMNADGTNVTQLHGAPTPDVMACQPRAFADNQIIFSSNEAAPGTDAFDMYSILPDGSKLTRITNNNLYDGFSIWWMGYNSTTAAARAVQKATPVQQRLDHLKTAREHKRK
ncbi:MAG: hypothetical protein WA628_22160 [Terriglobales bacterium]